MSAKQAPLDLFVLLILVPAHTQLDGNSFLLGTALLLYLALAFWHPLTSYDSLPTRFDRTRLTFLVRLFLLFIMISAALIIPAFERVKLRIDSPIDESGFSPAFAKMHDGALHVESALGFLSEGKNPYVERYDETPMRFFGFSGVDMEDNPHYQHLPYLPGLIISSIPVYLLSETLGLLYDQRLIYLVAYAILVLLLPLMANAPTNKLFLIAAVGLNPLIVGPVILGMNDVVVTVFLIFTVLLLQRNHTIASAIMLGIAVVTKQSAWFFVPFYLLYLVGIEQEPRDRNNTIKALAIIVVFIILIFGPFAIWDFNAFWSDVMAFPSGGVEFNYPIRGYTLGVLLVGSGIIESPLDRFPFWVLQLAIGIPLLLLMLRYQWKRNKIGTMIICSALFLFLFGFLSRYFQDNYLGFVSVFLTIGLILNLESKSSSGVTLELPKDIGVADF